jgi:hypothetical protein
MKTILVLLILSLGATLSGAESPADLLTRSDANRTIPDLAFAVEVTSYDGAQVSDQSGLWGV